MYNLSMSCKVKFVKTQESGHMSYFQGSQYSEYTEPLCYTTCIHSMYFISSA